MLELVATQLSVLRTWRLTQTSREAPRATIVAMTMSTQAVTIRQRAVFAGTLFCTEASTVQYAAFAGRINAPKIHRIGKKIPKTKSQPCPLRSVLRPSHTIRTIQITAYRPPIPHHMRVPPESFVSADLRQAVASTLEVCEGVVSAFDDNHPRDQRPASALQVAVLLEPAHREEAPGRWQVERRESVTEDGGEGCGFTHPRSREPNRQTPFDYADPAGDGGEAGE